ncbi:hypothetical protein B5808_08105 [Cnuibacter physcomitrellae]|uniref:FAD dependent oxidoreductase domain-containing protein n=1 Tax=Cnuibacter physcomitrellae TaxID=1619308 RepID=A0A1X9LJ10_9MICO|nr:FAD-dependent oxidoreductase [Cnuibacter physcomitrellae]ARJ05175.1 hypothetical protein B5808_08105 [Cnuibacter physcomitrellae]
MATRVDVIVVGGGAMGSAAAWHLAGRGHDVLLLERFAPDSPRRASHGESRNFNPGYVDQTYLGMLRESLPLWRELEAESGLTLLERNGIVHHGAYPDLDGAAERLPRFGFEVERLAPDEAADRWPGMRFDREVLHIPDAGRLRAASALSALQGSAVRHGAVIRHHAKVQRIRVLGDDRAAVEVVPVDDDDEVTGAVESVEASSVVVATGAWTSRLVGRLVSLPSLVVTREQPMVFDAVGTARWPGFNHWPEEGGRRYRGWRGVVYGGPEGGGVKAGWNAAGRVVDPDSLNPRPDPRQRVALQRYVREWLPGADPDVFVEDGCTYTTTPDSNFIVDRIGPLVVGAGFSGHGFKFTPVVGRLLADLVEGRRAPALFSLRAEQRVAS